MVLDSIAGLLGRVDHDRSGLTAARRLELVASARLVHDMAQTLMLTLLAEADTADAEDVLVAMGARLTASDLEQATSLVLAVVAPADAAEQDGLRLQRQAEAAGWSPPRSARR